MAEVRPSDAAEKEYLEHVLTQQEGNVTVSATAMGVNRSHLQSLLKKHASRQKRLSVNRKPQKNNRDGPAGVKQ